MILDRREVARDWCNFAVADEAGRVANDPAYRRITEGRDRGPSYSSCGDLAHWLLFVLGCREPWINRVEHNGWRGGLNINLLAAPPVGVNPIAESNLDPTTLETGDVALIWKRSDATDAHALIVDHIDAAGLLHSWDYGQGPLDPAAWAGGQRVEGRKRRRLVSSIKIRSVIRLSDVPLDFDLMLLPTGEAFDDYEGLIK